VEHQEDSVDQLLAFYRSHGLPEWADALDGLAWPAAAGGDGFVPVVVMPPVALQRAQTALLLEAMTAPTEELPAEEHYGGYWVPSVEMVADCEILDRPEGPYALCLRDGPFPESTLGLTCTKLVKEMEAHGWTGLTVHEFLVVQRFLALRHGDHRWSSYYEHKGRPPGIQWLPNARSGKKVFQGYWVAKSGQVQIGACATGSKKPTRGAHPCRVTALS